MKEFFLLGISTYQLFFSPLLKLLLGTPKLCRFSPSCSEYAKQMVGRHGVLKGSKLSLERIIQCR